jgi:hypothetical protein
MAAVGKIITDVIDHNGMKINLERKFNGKIIGLYFRYFFCTRLLFIHQLIINFYL